MISKSFFKDYCFYGLLALGPIFVLLLSLFSPPKEAFWFLNQLEVFFQFTLVSAIVEEIIFRGFLDEILKKSALLKNRVGPLTYRNILISLLFTALHFFWHSPLWALLVIIPSLIFGYSKKRYETIVAPILIHLIYNLCYFAIYR